MSKRVALFASPSFDRVFKSGDLSFPKEHRESGNRRWFLGGVLNLPFRGCPLFSMLAYREKRFMAVKRIRENRVFLLILAIFVALGCCHILWTPIFVKPDEEWHFAYVVYIRQTGSLPSAQERTAYEGYQPPLYYLLGAMLTLPISLDDVSHLYHRNPHFLSTVKGNYNLFAPCPGQAVKAVYLLRFLSLAFGIVAVIATYLTGLRFCSREIALMGSAAFAFLPTFTFITTSVSNDAAVISFMALTLLVATGILKGGLNARAGALFGLFAGLATLSKLIGLFSFALLPLLALKASGPSKAKKEGIILAFSGLLLPLPWFIRNYFLFGDPFALFGLSPKPEADPRAIYEMALFAWKSFWLDFSPGRLLYGPPWIYWVYASIVVTGITGLLRGLRRSSLTSRSQGAVFSINGCTVSSSTLIAILYLYSLLFVLIFTSLLWISIKHFTGGGRYLLPVGGAGMLLIALGLKNLFPYRYVSPLWCALFGLLALYAIFGILMPGYYPPRVYFPTLNPIGFLSDEIALLSYSYDKESLAPGDDLRVTITWQLLRPTSQRYSVFVQLLAQNENGEHVIAQVDTYPGLGYYPTCQWEVGKAVRDLYILRLPKNAPISQGSLRLIAGMYQFETMERLTAYQVDQQGERRRVPQDAFTLGFLKITGQGDQ